MVSQLSMCTRPTESTARSEDLKRLRELPCHLEGKIRGQEHILGRVCSVLTRGELGFAHPRRPRGSFLFVGPTGVGKTETTNIFTRFLFADALPVRFDMSEYQLQRSVEKLIGGSPGDMGLLGRALRGRNRGTLLFDEIEKAHPLILDLFLQILEDARITLATGETVDLSGFYIVCTSNIGSSESMRMESAPFASMERAVLMRVHEQLRPELVGRVSELVVFGRLNYTTQRAICEKMIIDELSRLRGLGHDLQFEPSALEFIVREGYHRTLGARPMRVAVERHLQNAVTADLLTGGSGCGKLAADKASGLVLMRR